MKNKIIYCIGGILCFLAMFTTVHAEDQTDPSDLEVRISQNMAALETRLAKDAAERETRTNTQIGELETRLTKDAAERETRINAQIEMLRTEMKADNAALRTEMKADNAALRLELSELRNSLPSAWGFYLTVWGATFSIIITLVITIIITGRRMATS